ncbi:MAG: hypothetical protein R3B06_09770 [Kofleriaceae bacterium]
MSAPTRRVPSARFKATLVAARRSWSPSPGLERLISATRPQQPNELKDQRLCVEQTRRLGRPPSISHIARTNRDDDQDSSLAARTSGVE